MSSRAKIWLYMVSAPCTKAIKNHTNNNNNTV